MFLPFVELLRNDVTRGGDNDCPVEMGSVVVE